MIDQKPFDALSALLVYPDAAYDVRAHEAFRAMYCNDSEAGDLLMLFLDEIGPMSPDAIEELYTITFDLNPVVTLDLGWHLYGEAYERGRLMAQLRAMLMRAGLEENGELPDHLSSVLRLLPRLPEGDGVVFANSVVLPALEKMSAALEGGVNPFRHLLGSIHALVSRSFPQQENKSTAPAAGISASAS